MATDPATLLSESNCFSCYASPGTVQLMMLALLRQIVLAQNPMADTSPQALLAQANCYRCFAGTESLLMLALLAQIANNGGGGGGSGGGVFEGSGAPSGLQPGQDGTKAAIYLDTDPGGLWYGWSVLGQAWF